MMVVVPTSTVVSMSFEPSLVDRSAYVLTLGGFVALYLIRRSNRRSDTRSEEVSMSSSDEFAVSPGETADSSV
jgi:NO-binding membrane sensor protein with MHYT domain